MRNIYFQIVAVSFVLGSIALSDEPADPGIILDEVIKAQGGETALNKFIGMYLEAKGTAYVGNTKAPAL